MRTSLLTAALALLLAAPLAAQQTLLTYDGDFKGGNFGDAVTVLGKQADGYPGLLVGCADDDANGLDAGAAYVLSGKDGHVIRVHHGEAPGDRFGSAVATMGDVNGDGRVDYAIGAPFHDGLGADAGRVRVYSGTTGLVLATIDGPAAGQRFGSALADIGYVSIGVFGAVEALAIGAPYANGPGGTACGAFYVRLWSGETPDFPPSVVYGIQPAEHFGSTLSATFDNLAVGAPDYDLGSSTLRSGRFEAWVRAYPSQLGQPTLQKLWSIEGTVAGGALGTSVAVVRWMDGLAGAQFAAGAPFAAIPYVTVQRDVNGVPHELAHPVGSGQFGSAIASGRYDATSPSFGWVAVGSPLGDTSVTAGGRVTVWIEGLMKQVLTGTHAAGHLGAALGGELGLPDDQIDQPGGSLTDWLIAGAPDADVAAVDDGFVDTWNCAGGQAGLVHQVSESEPPASGDRAGQSVAGVGDVDGDGVPDQLVGCPKDDLLVQFPIPSETPDTGSARVLSGATGAVLRSHYGAATGDELGWSAAAVGDIDLDGAPDYFVGAPQRHNQTSTMGYARLYSGATGAVLHTFSGAVTDDEFGFAVGGGSDVNGDGRRDLLVGAPGTSKGTVYLYSAANYFLLGGVNGQNAGDRFGAAVAGLGDDSNGDGNEEWIAGAPNYDVAGNQQGRAYLVRSTASLLTIWTVTGTLPLEHTGAAVAAAGDVNDDGTNDVLVGAPISHTANAGPGKVRVISGLSVFGTQLAASAGDTMGDEYGTAVALLGDLDGDGHPDWAAGAPQPSGSDFGKGYVKVVSGQGAATILTVPGHVGEGFGTSVAAAGDVNGDGAPDLLAGGPELDGNGINSGEASVTALPGVGSPWTDLGFALAGSAGLPALVGHGSLLAGSFGTLTLSSAAPSALAYLFISLAENPTPFKGGTLVAVPPVLTAIVVTSPTGGVPLVWSAWPSGLSGLDLYFQYAIQDAGAVQGAALSNALKAAVP